ncbi:hypothetical protein E3V55_01680 [Candidatus Marinimicrobia bacterium MT.SAG.3]|nr:hypothetical protein [Candidatus Neomarinimicrobiota bacterium]TFB12160.1 hypothetical protein E3V55_01680 [Candidatus Marinimicrobia bacterium MT.SAG.3]
MTAYLSGAMEYSPDQGRGWRQEVSLLLKERLGHEVFNPNEEINQILSDEEELHFREWKENDEEKFKTIMNRIIDRDLRHLTEKSDYVICKWDEYAVKGGGTHGEITVAYYHKIPVFLLSEMPRNRISSWILGCSENIFFDVESLLLELEIRYKK